MKFQYVFAALALSLAAVGCSPAREVVQIVKGDKGDPGTPGAPGADGTSCSVAPELDSETFALLGARISCTDGSSAIILNGVQGPQGVQGLQGAQGAQGVAGQNGASCSVSRGPHASYATIYCPFSFPVRVYDGEDGRDGDDGRDGASCSVSQTHNGAKVKCGSSVAFIYNGTNGTNGSNGTSCSVSSVPNGAKITCGATSQIVSNGTNGTNGQDGEDGLDSPLANALGIAAILKPCGNEFDNDEVLIKLTDNSVLALYDGGANLDRLTILVPGLEYKTTDRNGNGCCKFKLNASGDFAYNSTYNNNQCN